MRHGLTTLAPLATLSTFAAAFACWSTAAPAQRARPLFGAALEWRSQVGALSDSVDRRKGLAIRVQADVPWTNYVGWRIEGSYVQVQYDRADPTGPTPINETGLELGGFVRALQPGAGRARLYLLAGPIASLRATCDIDNAFGSAGYVRCGSGKTFLLGWGAGGGVRFPNSIGGWTWFVETRVVSNVTSVAGGRLVAIAFGAGN